MEDRIKEIREKRGLTQKQVANAIGVSEKRYRSLEEDIGHIRSRFLIKLADYYDVSTDYLLGLTEKCSRRKK